MLLLAWMWITAIGCLLLIARLRRAQFRSDRSALIFLLIAFVLIAAAVFVKVVPAVP